MSKLNGKLRRNQKLREGERLYARKQEEIRRVSLQHRREIDALKQQREIYLDLGRYAGTYGGWIEAPAQPSLWQRFKAWLNFVG